MGWWLGGDRSGVCEYTHLITLARYATLNIARRSGRCGGERPVENINTPVLSDVVGIIVVTAAVRDAANLKGDVDVNYVLR